MSRDLSACEAPLCYFAWEHLPKRLQPVSRACADLANAMTDAIPQGPELSAGLRKLLEAKDCFVRAALQKAFVEEGTRAVTLDAIYPHAMAPEETVRAAPQQACACVGDRFTLGAYRAADGYPHCLQCKLVLGPREVVPGRDPGDVVA